ncbi:MAG: hypothetical protein DHS20C06_15700 [Hyphobacterium sp.]|nr:MAG: hypothetical protein DHS20C06_15700 [Hyphobacterium sp.]
MRAIKKLLLDVLKAIFITCLPFPILIVVLAVWIHFDFNLVSGLILIVVIWTICMILLLGVWKAIRSKFGLNR